MTDACVFCSRRSQPAPLLEGPLLYVMPDKFPLVPGHTLIICKAHLPCYAAAPDEVLEALAEASDIVGSFLREAYRSEVQIWENGVAGQTVFHAHLHLIPVPYAEAPAELAGHPDVSPVDGWEPVRTHYRQHGSYRYAGFGPERYLIHGHSPVMGVLRDLWQRELGLRWGGRDWLRETTPDDVLEVGRRWREWVGRPF